MADPKLIQEINVRLQAIFTAYHQGKDVAPAVVFQTEGLLQAACLLEFLNLAQAQQLVKDCWVEVFQTECPVLSADKIQIPVNMNRAPVYPTS